MNEVKLSDGFVNKSVIKDRPLFEIVVNPINDVVDKLSCELLVMSEDVFIILWPVEVAIVDDMLQNLQLTVDLLQKHFLVAVFVL